MCRAGWSLGSAPAGDASRTRAEPRDACATRLDSLCAAHLRSRDPPTLLLPLPPPPLPPPPSPPPSPPPRLVRACFRVAARPTSPCSAWARSSSLASSRTSSPSRPRSAPRSRPRDWASHWPRWESTRCWTWQSTVWQHLARALALAPAPAPALALALTPTLPNPDSVPNPDQAPTRSTRSSTSSRAEAARCCARRWSRCDCLP